jgi:triosephosphate isomerase
MRKTLILGNWKMHLNVSQASLLLHRLQERVKTHQDIEVVLAPTMLTLQPLSVQLDRRKFRLAAQNAYQQDEGAFTGEISFTMLRELVHYVIVGHSERRIGFHEDLEIVRDKVAAAIRNEITPIICVGESTHEHMLGEGMQVLHDQVVSALSNLTAADVGNIVLVYEPQWTISTSASGAPAKPDEAKKGMDFIRHQVSELYGEKAAQKVRVLYGGSVDDHSARAYLELEGCDGVLVGSASLNYHKFSTIVEKAFELRQEQESATDGQ